MEGIGEKLKNLRLEKGLTLEDVHRKTKIHLNVLKAIEEGSLVNFSPVYIKGFLKIYCKFLGIEYSDSLFDHKQPHAASRIVPEKKRASLPAAEKKPLLTPQAMRLIQGRLKTALLIGAVLLLTIGLFRLGKFISLKISQAHQRAAVRRTVALPPLPAKEAKKSDPAKARKAAQKPAAAVVAAPKAVVKPVAAPQKAEEPAVSSGIRLGIRAKEDCWLHVKTDGKTIFQNILKKGRFESWQAKEKIELSLGNAGVVELEVNGKLISSLGRRGQAIKNISITKEGLTVAR